MAHARWGLSYWEFLLLVIQPVRAQEAASGDTQRRRRCLATHEGGRLRTRHHVPSARDPEGTVRFSGRWSGTDAGVFSIDGGVLRFKSPLQTIENPRDRDVNADSTTTGTAVDRQITTSYRVTVRFGGRRPGRRRRANQPIPHRILMTGDDLGELNLTITVTNVNEDGTVSTSPRCSPRLAPC